MHDGKTKITDIQVSLGHVITFVVGLGGLVVGIGGVLLFLGNLLWVDKKEFWLHKEENVKTCAEITQKVAEVEKVISPAPPKKPSHKPGMDPEN